MYAVRQLPGVMQVIPSPGVKGKRVTSPFPLQGSEEANSVGVFGMGCFSHQLHLELKLTGSLRPKLVNQVCLLIKTLNALLSIQSQCTRVKAIR